MKYVKMLGLLAVAAAAMMAFAASASAITVTEDTNDHIDLNDVIKATSTHTELTGSIPITCTNSEVVGTVTKAGGTHGTETTDVAGNVTEIKWGNEKTECGTTTVKTVKGGELTLEYIATNEATLTSYEAEVTVTTHGFFTGTTHCIYKTKSTEEGGTHLGKVTDKTLAINSTKIPQKPTDGLCSDDAVWHGHYTVTQPANWDID